MPTCQGKLWNDEPCGNIVKEGQTYCSKWHDPEDQSWREIYEYLKTAMPKEKTNIVLGLIQEHPERILKLPKRDGVLPNLRSIDLRGETLKVRKEQLGVEKPAWWSRATKGANLRYADLQGAILEHAKLKDANLERADLKGANLKGAILQCASLIAADLQDASLVAADLKGADLRGAKIQGVDLSGVDDMTNVNISDAWLDKTRISRDKLGGEIGEETKGYYKSAKRGYLALKQNFDDLGDYDASSWAYRKERRMEKLEAKTNGQKALKERNWKEGLARYFEFTSDTFVEWLCDYGESVWRVIVWIALLIISGPFLFWALGGFYWPNDLHTYYSTLTNPFQRYGFILWNHFLYTLDVFTTASLSGLEPKNDVVKLFSYLYSIVGIFLVGLLGFVAGNRIRRS